MKSVAISQDYLKEFAKKYCDWKIGRKQLRALVTSYCILNDIEVDTFAWDTLIIMLHNATKETCPSWNRISMDRYLCRDLV